MTRSNASSSRWGSPQSEFTSYTTWNAETASGTAPKPGRVHIYTASAEPGQRERQPGRRPSRRQWTRRPSSARAPPGAPRTARTCCTTRSSSRAGVTRSPRPPRSSADLGYYGDHGGHFFATHYSYSWLNTNANSNLMSVAQWDPRANTNATPTVNGVNFTGNVSTTVPVTVPVTNPGRFVQWLNYVGALANSNPAAEAGSSPGQPHGHAHRGAARRRQGAQSIGGLDRRDRPEPEDGLPSQMLLHFTFDMPIPTAGAGTPTQCGHGIYSDFHVVSSNQSNGTTFPAECDKLALNSQERILEYMIWDLASCVPGPPTSTCTPKTCARYPAGTCGQQTDGCNGLTANCGTCAPGLTCGGGGTPAVCGAPDGGACTPLTCASYAAGTCGQQSDGCGGVTPDCNPCPPGQTCGGGGVSGQCGSPPGTSCTPKTCAQQNIACGPAGDGCGNIILSCGSCPTSQSCGGGGVPGQCGGTNTCVPLTCAQQNIACGPAGDGCGNLIASCGTCVPPASCGGGGTPGQCGSGPPCVPKTCQELNTNCGPAGDGCGNLIPTCGTCAPPATCGGGGTAGQCGARSRSSKRLPGPPGSRLLRFAADVLVGPVVPLERPVLLVVLEVARRIERVDRVLRQVAEPDRLDLDLERALATEHALDAPEARAAQEAREAQIEPVQGVLRERGLGVGELLARRRDARLELRRPWPRRRAAGPASRRRRHRPRRGGVVPRCALAVREPSPGARPAAAAAARSARRARARPRGRRSACSTPSSASRGSLRLVARSSSAELRGRAHAAVGRQRALHVAERAESRSTSPDASRSRTARRREHAVVRRVDAHERGDRRGRPRGSCRRSPRRPRRSPSAPPRGGAASTRRSRRCAARRRAPARSAQELDELLVGVGEPAAREIDPRVEHPRLVLVAVVHAERPRARRAARARRRSPSSRSASSPPRRAPRRGGPSRCGTR